MFCTRCGMENPNDGRFCTRCGAASEAPGTRPPSAALSADLRQAPSGPVETSRKAIGSLICGLLFFFIPTAIIAVVLGHLSLSEIRKSAGQIKGHGMAVAGLVLGYLGVAFIPFILIIAAIAIPNLLRSKQAANEAGALGALRTIATAAIIYSSTYANGFPSNLDEMDGGGASDVSCNHAKLIDGSLASGEKNGYRFTYSVQLARGREPALPPGALRNGCATPGGTGFTVTADPVTRGTTGQRSFFIDESGVIRSDELATATADSPPIE